MKLQSPQFCYNGRIPRKFTVRGDNVPPGLVITDIPPATKSLALIIEDLETRKIHWAVYNIPVIHHIEENSRPGIEAVNDFLQHKYMGPGQYGFEQRLIFRLYALKTILNLGLGKGGRDVENAAREYMIGIAELVGQYKENDMESVPCGVYQCMYTKSI
jgi:phosphatidylethanolamine-binding protein (PEBP) family uncharacterized protein